MRSLRHTLQDSTDSMTPLTISSRSKLSSLGSSSAKSVRRARHLRPQDSQHKEKQCRYLRRGVKKIVDRAMHQHTNQSGECRKGQGPAKLILQIAVSPQ